ncbi:MAG: N-acetyltransferase family protein [Acidimicrobiales bacterium]
MEETTRVATDADLARIVELAQTAIAELEPTRGGAIWVRREGRPQPVDASLATAVGHPDHLVLVGCLGEVVVGYAVTRLDTLHDGSSLAVVDDIYVEPGARSLGIGELMMDAIVEWATDRGCVGIDSLALPGNRATKNFFESFGLVARAILVHRSLVVPEHEGDPGS